MTGSLRRWVRALALLQVVLVAPFPVSVATAIWHPGPPPPGTDGPAAFVGLLLLPVVLAYALPFFVLTTVVCIVCFRRTRPEQTFGEGVRVVQSFIAVVLILAACLIRSWLPLLCAAIGVCLALSMFLPVRFLPGRGSRYAR